MATIIPGDNWQAATNANPAGTTFGVFGDAAAEHLGCLNLIPKPGNKYLADTKWSPGSTSNPVCNGQNTTQYAIKHATSGAQPDDVEIDGIEFKNYTTASQQAAIKAGDGGSIITSGWIARGLYVHDCNNAGLRFGHRMKVLGGRYSRNGFIGMVGSGDDMLVDGCTINGVWRRCEVDNNNPAHNPLGFEAGGIKFVKTNRLICRGLWVHDNYGNGAWADICNDRLLFEDIVAEDNYENGLSIEISYSAIIRDCLCRRNGWKTPPVTTWPSVAGIGIHHSGGAGIEVYRNRLIHNAFGLGVIQQARGTAFGDPGGEPLGPYVTQNVYAHDNIIVMRADSTGAVWVNDDSGTQMGPANAIFTSRNNRFLNNRYFVNQVASPFNWLNATRSYAAWQGFGNDVAGTRVEMAARFERGDP